MKNTGEVVITTPTPREVVLTRAFAAPRSLVFDACTQPDLLKRWLAAPGRSLEVCEVDLRPGGRYRMVWRGPGKKDVGMHGIYRDVTRPERFVRTEAWEDWDAGESLDTTVFTEQNGTTTLTITMLFPSQDVRDTVLESGLERGARENYDKLADMLADALARPVRRPVRRSATRAGGSISEGGGDGR